MTYLEHLRAELTHLVAMWEDSDRQDEELGRAVRKQKRLIREMRLKDERAKAVQP